MNPAVTVPALPSVTLTSLIDSVGTASSFVIVPIPLPSAIVAFTGPLRFTPNVSFASNFVSPFTVTLTGRVAWPGVKVSVPDPAT